MGKKYFDMGATFPPLIDIQEAMSKAWESIGEDLKNGKDPFESLRDEHRKGYSDMEWAGAQSKGAPNYDFGDVVEFKVGGFGRIDAISLPNSGWPSSYSTMEVKGFPCHPTTKCAWHYEGDFLRLKEKASKELSEIMAEMKGQSDSRMAAYAMRDLNTNQKREK